ncbi:hypothetical protein D9758_000646 [Tetrapyrgos nigripes]|uniref:Uncharacterized protein n=1 Tax=Tetrapyrgos nigripes TaxID=182062 RepID=A0A8H5GZD0_9AGAR|nr:hypothetical protein D9758_000646 [Tetrapyrgos nigripes]
MSTVSAAQQEFDFWEFVNAVMYSATIISVRQQASLLWTVSKGDLDADQSCAQCGAPGIQLIPLQHDMEPPMSDWFRSVPYSLEAAAYAARFQLESMASQIRSLKARHQQQRAYIERLKRENAELEQLVAQLSGQHGVYDNQEPSSFINSNGKRPLFDPRQTNTSSPHSVIGVNRLTIPPDQQPPHLSSRTRDGQTYPSSSNRSDDIAPAQQRPRSSKFAQQYAFIPSARPPTHQSSRRPSEQNPQFQERPEPQATNKSLSMMPPPSATRLSGPQSNGKPPLSQPRNMTPLHSSRLDVAASKFYNQNLSVPSTSSGNANHRFSSTNNGKRFVPSAPTHASERLGTGIGRLPIGQNSMPVDSRAAPRSFPGGSGQRVPFVPR